MKLRTGLESLIGLSVLGIAVAVFLIYTCPFAGQISFSALVREVPHGGEHQEDQQKHDPKAQTPSGRAEEHPKEHEKKGEHQEGAKAHPEPGPKPHESAAKPHEDKEGLSIHFMAVPNVRQYPAKETKVFAIDVNPIGIITLLLLIGLCVLILRQQPLHLFGYTVTPKAMGATVFLITLWNLVFAAFLVGVEVFQFREL